MEQTDIQTVIMLSSAMSWRQDIEQSHNSTLLDLGTRCSWSDSFPCRFTLGETNPFDKKLEKPHSQFERHEHEKNLFALPGIEPRSSSP
jgi:hypothetical protein